MGKATSYVSGSSAAVDAENVVLERLSFDGKVVRTARAAHIQANAFAHNVTFLST